MTSNRSSNTTNTAVRQTQTLDDKHDEAQEWVMVVDSDWANKVVSSPTPKPHTPTPTTSTSIIPRSVIRLAFLKHRPFGLESQTIREICVEVVRIDTAVCDTSLVESLSRDPALTKHFKSVADVFVSFAWSLKWGDILGAFESKLSLDTFVWMDVFVVNQRASSSMVVEEWLSELSTAILETGRVVVEFAPWRLPTNLQRAWSVFELLVAVDASSESGCGALPQSRPRL